MESLTEPMTRPWMEYALSQLHTKPVNWKAPKGIKTEPAFVVRRHIHYGDIEPSPANDLFPSWYVGGKSGKNTSQTLDRVSNKVATSCTPPAAKEYAYNATVGSWNIDIFNGGSPSVGGSSSGSGNTKEATDDVHNCNDSPPSVTLTAPGSCDNSCTITATVTQGTHPLNDPKYYQFPGTLTFTLNGKTIHTSYVSNSPSTVSFNYKPPSSGSGTLTATVTDSVLYSASASSHLSYSSPQPKSLTLSLGAHPGTTANFSWNSLGSGYTYQLCLLGGSCKPYTSTSGFIDGLTPGTHYEANVSSSGTVSPKVSWTQ
jgi:hypothetical protein